MRGATSPDFDILRKAAGAVASTLLLSNSVGISRTETAETIGFVKFSDVPHLNRSDLDFVLKRRFFESLETDRFQPIHRTIAEFLAAEDLSNRIMNGLPIGRIMALVCGIDGRPVSSLRGLFAWLMCMLGEIAEYYVDRDPYGVTTYGDASVLPPSAQRKIWVSLSQLRDPWFLTNEDDRSSFRELANPNTVDILQKLLEVGTNGDHLKIAVLEAIANSTVTKGLSAILKSMVLEKHHNKWLRSTALKAYVQSIQSDSAQLEALDELLANTPDDPVGPEIRMDLLLLTRESASKGIRILSILKQAAASTRKSDRIIIGRFYPLIGLPSDSDLDVILDEADRLKSVDGLRFDLSSLFENWLRRRLESSNPIEPLQLARWLRNLPVRRNNYTKETLLSLKTRFKKEPELFEMVFKQISSIMPNEGRSFRLFIARDLWNILPTEVWPISQSEFFLGHAEREMDPKRAAVFFQMYLSRFPIKHAPIALAEAGFDLIERRSDIARVLINWNSCKIEKWQKEQWKKNEKERRKMLARRNQNIAFLTQRLATIREGSEVSILAWAVEIYLGLNYDVTDIPDAHERLVSVTNEEIADAFVQGFLRYAESPDIPKKDIIIEKWMANSIPYTHILLSLSVFLRCRAGMNIPEEALPNCIAAAVTSSGFNDKVHGYDETLSAWLIQKIRQNPVVVDSVLREMWILGAKKDRGLPGFYEIRQDPGSQQFIASLSAEVLKTGINDNHDIVNKLTRVLIYHDGQSLLSIGETELLRNELSLKVRTIWNTALFVIDPEKYKASWRNLMSEEDATLWIAIGFIRGARSEKRGSLILTTEQHAEIVAVIGKRFPNVGHPPNGWSGSQNPWDASEFIADQIRAIAADCSAEAAFQLERLEKDCSLASYHNLIRHHRAQNEKQQRESGFTFASPKLVAEAILNRAPATPNDLLAFIVDHLGVLAYELARTQNERYRAYWNESGHNLTVPKREEVCSGFLAEDLQNRIRAHGVIVTVEHHMVADKECDLVIMQGTDRLLPVEVKHHYNRELWTAWRNQLDHLYTRDAKAGGLGIYLVLWSGEIKGRKMPKIPSGLKRPSNAKELCSTLESLIPIEDQHRLRIVVVDISKP